MDEAQEKIGAFIKGEIQSYCCQVCDGCAKARANKIINKVEELGYRKPKEKPPLLSDEDIKGEIWAETIKGSATGKEIYRRIAKAQREADIKHYEGT